jgi:ABC-type multidrug transport system fused ATPase/permease subunit
MFQNLKKLLYLLTAEERKGSGYLLTMIIIMALLDMMGVASIMPFMAVLTNPQLVETNEVLIFMFQRLEVFGVKNNQQFLFSLGVLVFMLLVLSLIFKALTLYVQIKFTAMREYSIGKRLVEGYLDQTYSWFLSRNSSDLSKNILSEVSSIIANGISPMITLIAQSAVVFALISLLILVDLKITLICTATLGISYVFLYTIARGLINRMGHQRLKDNQSRFLAVSEAFGAAKEIKVNGLEQTYIKRFSNAAESYSKLNALSSTIGQLPRYAIEIVAFGGMILLVLYLLSQSSSFNSIIPVLSLYVLAGYRLIPALQQIYLATAKLRFIGPAIDSLHGDLKNLKPKLNYNSSGSLSFNKTITLNHIHYNYPNSSRTALKDISLSINANTKVGLVGVTGSGKSTTVDIILGLLEPQKGTLEVDGKIINKSNNRDWQSIIGYVPQNIYLADDTLASNIAFGIEKKYINHDAVVRAAKIANLHEFVEKELSLKYLTIVGERGIRLSGGQRQRIGIARALYHNPKVLILDEATSALDNLTEKSVMDAVYQIKNSITIILIAHRLSTVKNCDNIFLLEEGKLKGQGTYDKLLKYNDNFRANASIL